MDIMTHAKFHFNRLMLTLIFDIRASEPPRAWRTTEKAGPGRVNCFTSTVIVMGLIHQIYNFVELFPLWFS